MPIVWLICEERLYVPRFLPIVSSVNSLLASVRMDFELIVELYISDKSKYQYQYKVNSQNTENTDWN